MIVTIQPSKLSGVVEAPASKSSMQRALAAALLKKGTSVILNPGNSNDDKAALNIIKNLGAKVEIGEERIIVKSKGILPVSKEINCGESGLSMRMFIPIAALSSRPIIVTGEGSLLDRPMYVFDEVFPQLGVNIQSDKGKLPLMIKGPLKPANIEIDGSLSSQFLTGLLMAYSAAGASDVSIKVNNLKSRPYIDLTFDVIKRFGLKLPVNKNYKEFYFSIKTPGSRLPTPDSRLQTSDSRLLTTDYIVETDWSNGAFLLVAGAIAGPVTIRGLDLASLQADKAIVDVMMMANAGIAIEAKGIKVRPASMNSFEFDATDCPDLFPPLVALAAYCEGESRIKGVDRLIHKESNRALTLQEEFAKMNVPITLNEDEMIIHGGRGVKGVKVHSHHDHRIAMACAIAALKADDKTIIEEAQAVNKSYPEFYTDLKKLGVGVSLSPS